jgi:hypothetical protein
MNGAKIIIVGSGHDVPLSENIKRIVGDGEIIHCATLDDAVKKAKEVGGATVVVNDIGTVLCADDVKTKLKTEPIPIVPLSYTFLDDEKDSFQRLCGTKQKKSGNNRKLHVRKKNGKKTHLKKKRK